MVITVRIDEELVRKIEELAKLRGTTRSALIREILNEALDRRSVAPVREAVLALRHGRKPDKAVDWSKIEQELQQTEPYFPTVEEAITYSRKRL